MSSGQSYDESRENERLITTNRPVLFLVGVRPRGARRSRIFLHYFSLGEGRKSSSLFQFGEKGVARGARAQGRQGRTFGDGRAMDD